MDDAEFRRTIMTDPNAKSAQLDQAIADDPSRQNHVDEIREFNALISDAVNIDVPADLESKLLQQISADSADSVSKQARQVEAVNDNKYWQIAAAACFAFVIGLSINLNGLLSKDSMGAGEYALKNTYQGMHSVSQTDVQIPLAQLNTQLASFGVEMEQNIGRVYSASSFFCGVNHVNVLHVVVEGAAGNISMYILPKDNKLDNWNEFSDDRYKGKATRYSQADMVIVGEKGEPLKAFQSKVENSMRWRT